MSPRTRGNRQGSVYLRKGRWFIRFTTPDGARKTKLTTARSKTEALRIVGAELERIWGRGVAVGPTLVSDLHKLVVRDRETRGQDLKYADKRWRNLKASFGSLEARAVTTEKLNAFVAMRRSEGAANATINREIAHLRRAFRLGFAATPRLVEVVPIFPRLPEHNARQGFVTPEEFAEIEKHLDGPHLVMARIAFWTGWRKGEILQLTWADINLKEGWIRIGQGKTKNRESRLVFMPAPLLASVTEWREQTRAVERRLDRVIQHVIHRGGEPLRWHYGEWRKAVAAAGHPGLLMHDLRRSAVRNLVRSGVSETVARAITGHKTRSVFDRYDITSELDLREAAERVSVGANAAPTERGRVVNEAERKQ